ncbi:UDP-N-acetylmuramate--L-alanine ligase [Tropheryma whipplei]|uniref:UDP-N-acetylmuramate--L-alanine ligase n=1 Tax=Tropheryma whipplei TaxID=2039 RepID=UPI0004BCDA1D|nr:UDP-N-acetylmuramate--L-alanine ligase [Tropheryma whipplei]
MGIYAKDVPLPESINRAHFCGIGGSGMSAVARLFLQLGISVSGTDRSDSITLSELSQAGAIVKVGHDPAMLEGVDTFVYSGAIDSSNPEYAYAKRARINLLHRSLALKWITRGKRLISIAGSHGKTSTTGMIATALHVLGNKCGVANGSYMNFFSANAFLGLNDLFVIEADESDGSFLFYDTDISVVNNISMDHVDYYGSQSALEGSFFDFSLRSSGAAVISLDDAACIKIASKLLQSSGSRGPSKRVITFGKNRSADVCLYEMGCMNPARFTVLYEGRFYNAGFKGLFGEHHAVNTCAALSVLLCLGYGISESLEAILSFSGTRRRLELHFDSGGKDGIKIFDDYAHHPREIRTALTAIRSVQHTRLIALFQPHLYSRTAALHREFASVLENCADFTIILPVYAARESPIPGVDAKIIFDAYRDKRNVVMLEGFDHTLSFFRQFLRDGDLVITLGCGDVYKIIPSIVEQLRSAR